MLAIHLSCKGAAPTLLGATMDGLCGLQMSSCFPRGPGRTPNQSDIPSGKGRFMQNKKIMEAFTKRLTGLWVGRGKARRTVLATKPGTILMPKGERVVTRANKGP